MLSRRKSNRVLYQISKILELYKEINFIDELGIRNKIIVNIKKIRVSAKCY